MPDEEYPIWVIGQWVAKLPVGEKWNEYSFVYVEDPLRWQITLSNDNPPRPMVGFEPMPGVEYVEEAWLRVDAANIIYEAGLEMVRKYNEAVTRIKEASGAKRIKTPSDADVLHINRGKRG